MNLAEFRAQFPQYDDIPDAQLVAQLHAKHYSDMPLADFQQKLGYAPGPGSMTALAKEYSPVDAALIGAGKSFVDTWEGVKQLFGQGRTEEERAEAERLYAPLKAEHPTATGVGESAPYLIAGGVAGAGPSLARTVGRQALAGAGVGALQEGDVANRVGSTVVEGAIGGAGGALGHVAGRLFGAGLDQAAPHIQNAIARAQGLGYEVLPTTGLPGRNLKQVVQGSLETMPGSAYALDQLAQRNADRLAASAAEAIGQRGALLVDETLGAARKDIGGRIENIARSVPQVDVTPVITDLQRMLRTRTAPMIAGPEDPVGELVARTEAYLVDAAQKGGVTGPDLFTQQAAIGERARSIQMAHPVMADTLFDLQQSLLKALEKSTPAARQGEMAKARGQYRTLSQLEAGQNVDPVTGKVHAGRLASYLQRKDRYGFTEGHNRTPLYEGTRFLGRQQPELPTSGTSERTMGREILKTMGAGLGLGGAGGMVGGNPAEGAALGSLTGLSLGFLAPYAAARAYLHPMAYNWMRATAPGAIRNPLAASGQLLQGD
jgi:hypothetical protein